MSDPKRAKITDVHRGEAAALRALWDAKRPKRTQAEFGEHYGLGNQSNVGHYLAARIPLNLKAAAAFASELGCDVADFSPRVAVELGQLGSAVADIPTSQPAAIKAVESEALPGYISFDLLDVEAAAGNGRSAPESLEVIRRVNVLESWASAALGGDLSRIHLISARGTSMQGSIENGDVLFVDATVRAYDGDGIYVISRDNDVQVKRLQKLHGGALAIISDNRAYESERLTNEEANSVIVCGRVLAAWSMRKFW